ncbi:MAG: hypothetical protein ACKOHI_13495, partial [Phycisphaerales bacterium]
MSHAVLQQVGSAAQTCRQHASSSQPGLAWGIRQSPLAVAPHRPSHRSLASATQSESHVTEQQVGSASHTVAQQSGSS